MPVFISANISITLHEDNRYRQVFIFVSQRTLRHTGVSENLLHCRREKKLSREVYVFIWMSNHHSNNRRISFYNNQYILCILCTAFMLQWCFITLIKWNNYCFLSIRRRLCRLSPPWYCIKINIFGLQNQYCIQSVVCLSWQLFVIRELTCGMQWVKCFRDGTQ